MRDFEVLEQYIKKFNLQKRVRMSNAAGTAIIQNSIKRHIEI